MPTQYDTPSGFRDSAEKPENPDLYVKDGVLYSRKTGQPHDTGENVRKHIFDTAVGFSNMLKGK